MKFIAFMALLAFTTAASLSGTTPTVNKNVAFKSTIKEKTIKPGMKGTLLVTLKPVKGIHINLTPPMTTKLDSSAVFSLADSLTAPKNASNDYFDVNKMVAQPFTVAKSATTGKAILKGTFIYFFCSDAEGWCSKFKQPFELTVHIGK
jgi:hypothetical protein